MAPSDSTNSSSDTSEIEKTLDLLKKGKEKFLDEIKRHRNVTLVLGLRFPTENFAQWLAGDNTNLISVEDRLTKGIFAVSRNSTPDTEQIFPELIVNPVTNNAYYDCSEFSYARSIGKDIAFGYFFKMVATNAGNVRLIFIDNNPILINDFVKSLKISTNLVRNVNKFRNSIAYVSFVVDSRSPDKLIQMIGTLMIKAKKELKSPNATQNNIDFIDALLQKNADGQSYSKLAYYPRPDRAGPVSEIPVLQEAKARVVQLDKLLQMTRIDKDDFGYSISDKSKSAVQDWANKINEGVRQNAQTIANMVAKLCQQSVDEIAKKLKSIRHIAIKSYVNLEDAQEAQAKLKVADRVVAELSNVTNVTTPVLIEKLNYTLTALGIDTTTLRADLERLALGPQHLESLQQATGLTLDTKLPDWSSILKGIGESLSASRLTIPSDDIEFNDTFLAIFQCVTVIAHEMWQQKLKQIQSMNIQKLSALLDHDYLLMFPMLAELNGANYADRFALIVDKYASLLDMKNGLMKRKIVDLYTYSKHMDNFRALSGNKLFTWSASWVIPFRKTLTSIFHASKWYKYLNGLQAKLDEYEFHQDRSRYNVDNVADWGRGQLKNQNLQIGEHNFKAFLVKLSAYNIAGYDDIKNDQADPWKVNDLNHLLKLTLKSANHKAECPEEGRLVVTGDYVKLSDLVESDKKLKKICPGNATITSLDIYASNTFFADMELVAAKLKLTVIAPKYANQGKTIDLSGDYAHPHDPPKAANGKYAGNAGEVGKDGLSGEPGGRHLIVCEFCDGFSFKANGGNGGTGQHGGDGHAGDNGTDAQNPTDSCQFADRYEEIGRREEQGNHGINDQYIQYRSFGTNGTAGGDGGHGGAGGSVGKAGGMIWYKLADKFPLLTQDGSPGNDATPGKGGSGGEGGKDGNNMWAECHHFITYQLRSSHPEVNGRRSSGKSGIDGNKPDNSVEPTVTIERPVNKLIDHKIYMWQNLNDQQDRFKHDSMVDFLRTQDKHLELTKLYDPQALAEEFVGLEEQFQSLRQSNKADIALFYQSLLSRISGYAPKEQTNEKKKMLNYLYLALLGRVHNLASDAGTNLIIQVDDYLTSVKQNMDTLGKLRQKQSEREIVQKSKEEYNKQIDAQIKEAKFFIETQVTPAFAKIGAQIDEQIDKLIKETEELQKEAEKNQKELIEKREQLQKQLIWKGIFSAVKTASKAATFLGPPGMAIGTAVAAGTAIGEKYAFKDGGDIDISSEIKDLIDQLQKNLKTYNENSAKELKENIDTARNQTNSVPQLEAMSNSLGSIAEGLSTESSAEEIAHASEQVDQVVQTTEDQVKKDKDIPDLQYVLDALDNVKSVIQVGSDLWTKLRGDQSKIDATGDAIKQIQATLAGLEQYRRQIYSQIAPSLKQLQSYLAGVQAKLNDKTSQVSLDVTNWQVQGMLRDVKLQMRQATKGKAVEDDLARCVERLEEAMTVLTKIYDRIQSFQQQQQLANFMANINSAEANKINIKDPQLAAAVNKLEIVIRSNVVLQQYDAAVAALKQLVFPYAHLYLQAYPNVSTVGLNMSSPAPIEDLITDALVKIDNIQTQVVSHKASIWKYDKYSEDATWTGGRNSTAPLFVWTNGEHQNTIEKLLKGEKITVNADVRKSDPAEDAVKFNLVELNFKAKSGDAAQAKLTAILTSYKLNATHMGNSYSRFNGKYYVLSHEPQNIQYSFDKDNNGVPYRKNKVYDKLKEGNLMLSPYALWQFNLIKLKNDSLNTFEELAKFSGEIDLELNGTGQYVDPNGQANEELYVDQYYQTYSDDTNAKDELELAEQYKLSKLFAKKRIAKLASASVAQNQSTVNKSNALFQGQAELVSSSSGQAKRSVENEADAGALTSPVANSSVDPLSTISLVGNSSRNAAPNIDNPRVEPNANTSSNSSLSALSNSVDVHGNLLMGQLLVGMIAGKNATLANSSYMSPEQKQSVRVERLAQKIVPSLYSSGKAQNHSNQIHSPNTQWHRDWMSGNDTTSN